MIRIGCGMDAHQFADGRRLVLGGAEIPHHCGLAGHSDADALSHAICDALLGAMAAGDIGQLFPDSDPAYKNADSIQLLSQVAELLKSRGGRVINIDASVAAESPKLAPYINEMRRRIADAVCADESQISVKATTGDGLGFVGRKEGIAVFAVALINLEEKNA